ncbi:methyl-accepting chemotaxis protein [Cohnella lubricantis]|uniref:Methyl-accepting chemotaxis protein n=1 Tax=Cohnella lubricantis TaxID=2163172 RepID=A0A841T388_9BACL|nr:methyl-accepting chemotaxis protein [Cohnella lubricantis]MBB6676053.1 methyl-accepting chemotaxis protein [Cohnella lubricantis]MBP2118008.1 methyl-accepting chemotaxis protein [Cohnella lubricantis]
MKWFTNLRTSVKLISSFLTLSVLLAAIGIYGIVNLNKMNNSLDFMYDGNLLSVTNLLEAKSSVNEIRKVVRDLYIDKTAEQIAERQQQLDGYIQTVEQRMGEFGETWQSEESLKIYAKYSDSWASYLDDIHKGSELADQFKDDELLILIQGDMDEKSTELRQVLDDLIEVNNADAEQAKVDGNQLYQTSRNITIAVIAVSVLLCIVLGIFVSRVISKPLNDVVRLVRKVAGGDLTETTDYRSKDEVGAVAMATNDMVGNLRSIVGNITESSLGVAAAAEQISASTEEIANGSSEQAHSAQMINELFSELSTAIHSVAKNTEQAAEISDRTIEIAEQGGQVIQSSLESMNTVRTQMSRLEEDSAKIGDIIEVIEDISDQTNLLALNAAIEAARAGEQGRGFAVVADEVRKLAERSGEATKQIAVIIKGMQENTRHSVQAFEESSSLSKETGASFRSIAEMVNRAGEKVSEIAAASEEQAAQSSSVLTAVENISSAAQESAASSEETAATAQSLSQLAESLQHSVKAFKLS